MYRQKFLFLGYEEDEFQVYKTIVAKHGHEARLLPAVACLDKLWPVCDVVFVNCDALVKTAWRLDGLCPAPRWLIATGTDSATIPITWGPYITCYWESADVARSLKERLGRFGVLDRREDYIRAFASNAKLSPREQEVFRAAVHGLHGKEIAYRIKCATPTVDVFWHRIIRKTGCRNRDEVLSKFLLETLNEVFGQAAKAPHRVSANPVSVPRA